MLYFLLVFMGMCSTQFLEESITGVVFIQLKPLVSGAKSISKQKLSPVNKHKIVPVNDDDLGDLAKKLERRPSRMDFGNGMNPVGRLFKRRNTNSHIADSVTSQLQSAAEASHKLR